MIRAAAQGDADTIARLQLRAVVRAAGEAVDPEQLGTVEERVAGWAQQLADPARSALVFDLDGLLAGVVAFAGPAAGTATGELLALYVDPPAQGAGVGGALHDATLDRLRAAGFGTAWLWVFA
ncbi:MAG: family N-acetyltransferase, partial [Solirubrobacterales bacterium]|nr:family N-acetyltransferase [Solirubrobacterales bacterium]